MCEQRVPWTTLNSASSPLFDHNCEKTPSSHAEKLRSFPIYSGTPFHANFAQHISEDNPWPKFTPNRRFVAGRVAPLSSAVLWPASLPPPSIRAPSADFTRAKLNTMLFPIKSANPLIPFSRDLPKQNDIGILEARKKQAREKVIK
jgi:hypothetical protein